MATCYRCDGIRRLCSFLERIWRAHAFVPSIYRPNRSDIYYVFSDDRIGEDDWVAAASSWAIRLRSEDCPSPAQLDSVTLDAVIARLMPPTEWRSERDFSKELLVVTTGGRRDFERARDMLFEVE